jgi:hypothetical protein
MEAIMTTPASGSATFELAELHSSKMLEKASCNGKLVSVADALPADGRPVLALRRSGYNCCGFEVLTARYMPEYRPFSPWRDISGDAVSDSGSAILAWMYADALLVTVDPR